MERNQVHPMILKEFVTEFDQIPLLSYFGNQISKEIPKLIKILKYGLIFKKGHRTVRSNYRLIYLTSVTFKMLKRINSILFNLINQTVRL